MDINNEWGILKLQEKILEIMLYIHNVCKRNNITYYLMGGSALGAKRNQGFIPWDDDLDIFMTVDEYKKFKLALPQHTKYYLQEWGKCGDMITMAKVRDSSTTLIENALFDWNINHGIYVDIFILHKVGLTKSQIKKQYIYARYLVAKGLSTKHYKGKKLIYKLLLLLLKCFPNRFLLKKSLKEVYRYDKSSSFEYYCHFLGRAGLETGLYNKNIFMKPIENIFESTKLYVPTLLDQYLKIRWGADYMTPPSIDVIKGMQHPSVWNVNASFAEAERKIVIKKDESKLIL